MREETQIGVNLTHEANTGSPTSIKKRASAKNIKSPTQNIAAKTLPTDANNFKNHQPIGRTISYMRMQPGRNKHTP